MTCVTEITVELWLSMPSIIRKDVLKILKQEMFMTCIVFKTTPIHNIDNKSMYGWVLENHSIFTF